jgi:repressor of nif and glnA expression
MTERHNSEGLAEEEIVPRGQEIYERAVRPELHSEDEGKFVVIDVLAGTYASEQASSNALFFFARVGKGGTPAPAHRIGAF